MKPDPSRASALAKEGLELWDAGRLGEAAAKYVAALECADPNDYALPDYHAGLAGILSALERDAEACDQYRASLAVSVRHEPDEAGAAVIVARYFLAEHLLKMKEPNLPIFQWAFADSGTRVAYGQEPVHIGCATHYELRDIESERLIDDVDVPQPCAQIPDPKRVNIPQWVADVISKKQAG